MKKILLFAALLLPFLAFAQFPNNPNKMRLGVQTTADGLIFRSDTFPDYTPTSNKNAWFHFDTVAQKLYYHVGGSWEEFSGGTGIDSLKIENDSLYLYTNEGTFSDAIPTPDSSIWATLYALQDTAAAIRGDVPAPDGNGIYSGSGTLPGAVSVAANAGALTFNKTGFAVNNDYMVFDDQTVLGLPSGNGVVFKNGATTRGRIQWGSIASVRLSVDNVGFFGGLSGGLSMNHLNGLNKIEMRPADTLIIIESFKNYLQLSGSSGTDTRLPAIAPTSAASFWEHATDGTGSYKTPGAMTVVNPLGGTNTLQASLDSLEQSQNQIIIAADSFFVDDGTIVYLVSAGDTITLPTGGGGSDGNGIYSGSGNIPGGTTATATGNFTLRTISADEGIAWTADSIRMYGVGASVRTGADLAIHDGVSYGADGQVMTAGSGIKAEWTDIAALPVTNPSGGSNTLQAALDSIADLAASAGVDGNGIFDAANNNDTVRVTTTNLNSVWNINNNTSGYLNIQRPSAAFVNGLRVTSPGGITGSQVHSAFVSDRVSIQDRLDNVNITSSFDMVLGGRIASGDYAQMTLKTGAAEFTTSNGGRLRLVDAGLTSSVTIAAPVIPTPYTLTLPPNDGSFGQFLQTDGNGVTTWAAPTVPNVGGLGSYGTLSAAYTYTVQPLGTAAPVISLPTDGHTGFGSIQKVVSGAGHGFQALAGGDMTAEIIANVSIQPTTGTHPYYLQVYLNGSPIDMVAAQTVALGTVGNLSLSFLYQVPNNGIITMQLHSSDVRDVSILTRSLTMKKIQ